MGQKLDSLYYELGTVDNGFSKGMADAGARLATVAAQGEKTTAKLGGMSGAMKAAGEETVHATKHLAEHESAAKELSETLEGLKRALEAVGIALGAKELAETAVEMAKLASEAKDTETQFRATFGGATEGVQGFLEKLAPAYGMTVSLGQSMATSAGAIVEGMGASKQAAAAFSEKVLTLAADLAVARNVPLAETFDDIKSGIIGMDVPLKHLGITLDATRVQQVALSQTHKASAALLSDNELAVARLTVMYERAQPLLGAVTRAQGDASTHARQFSAAVEELKEKLGVQLLPTLDHAVTGLNGMITATEEHGPLVKGLTAAGVAAVALASGVGLINKAVAQGGIAKLIALLASPAGGAIALIAATAGAAGVGAYLQARQDEETRQQDASFEQTAEGQSPTDFAKSFVALAAKRAQLLADLRQIQAYAATAGQPGFDVNVFQEMAKRRDALQQELTLVQRQVDAYTKVANARATAEGTGGGTGGGHGGTQLTEEQREQLRKLGLEAQAAYQAETAKGTVTQVDDMRAELDRLITSMREANREAARLGGKPVYTDAQIENVRTLTENLIAATAAAEAADKTIKNVSKDDANPQADDFLSLSAREDQLRGLLETVTKGSAEEKVLQDALLRVEEKREELIKARSTSTTKLTDEQKRQLALEQEHLRLLGGAVDGAIQLAQAFGLVDDNVGNALRGVISIVSNMGDLKTAFTAFQGGTGSIFTVLETALPVIGGVASILSSALAGNDPAEEQRQQLLEKNNEAIQALTRTIGEFGKNITGTEFTSLQSAVATGLTAGKGGGVAGTVAQTVAFSAALARMGLTMADAERIAQELGVTFDRNHLADSLAALAAAMKQTQLTQLTQTFAGQLEALNAQWVIFDTNDPVAKLQALLKVFADPKFGAPALAKALAGLDLTSPEGRAEAQRVIEQLFQQLQAGTLSPSALGGLTPEQLLALMQQITGLIGDANQAIGNGGTGGYNVSTSITEATGDHLAGLLATANVWAQQTAEAVTALLAVARNGVPAVAPPSLTPYTGGAMYARSGSALPPIMIYLTPPAGMTPDTAAALGQTIGRSALDAIDRGLAATQAAQQRASGNALIS